MFKTPEDTQISLQKRFEETTKNNTKKTSFEKVESQTGQSEEFVDLINNLLSNMKRISQKEEYFKLYYENLQDTLGLDDLLAPLSRKPQNAVMTQQSQHPTAQTQQTYGQQGQTVYQSPASINSILNITI